MTQNWHIFHACLTLVSGGATGILWGLHAFIVYKSDDELAAIAVKAKRQAVPEGLPSFS